MLTQTTDAPVGASNRTDTSSPIKKQTSDTPTLMPITRRKLLQTRMDVTVGKMMRLEISSAPIIRIPTTIVTAVSAASSIL